MISIVETQAIVPGCSIKVMRGLSTDAKPIDVSNGSTFYEMDTDDTYGYDAENSDWVKIPKGAAPSPTPTPAGGSLFDSIYSTKVVWGNPSEKPFPLQRVISIVDPSGEYYENISLKALSGTYAGFLVVNPNAGAGDFKYMTPCSVCFLDSDGKEVIYGTNTPAILRGSGSFGSPSITLDVYFNEVPAGYSIPVGNYDLYMENMEVN